MNTYIFPVLFILIVFLLRPSQWILNKYFRKYKYANVVLYSILPLLFIALFFRKTVEEIDNGEYISLLFLTGITIFCIYKLVIGIKEVKEKE